MSSLPNSADPVESLRAERDAAHSLIAALEGELRQLRVERDLLRVQLQVAQRKLFAAKSEARGSEQRDLFLNEAEALAVGTAPAAESDTDHVTVGAHRRIKRGRKPLDPALPREVVRHELPVAERVCPHDGTALVEIGAEISEQLDIVPQQVRVIQHQRVKYACPCCDQGIKTTPAPARIIPKGLLTEAALAWITVAKYQDALPLYRLAALLARFGGDLSRNTLAASVVRLGTAVQPVINLLRDHLLDSAIVYGDETVVQVLKEPGRAAQSKSYLWAQMNGTGPPVRLFSYAPTRSTTHALALYAGTPPGTVLMTDGYAPYDEVVRAYGLVHLGCWAHYPESRFIRCNRRQGTRPLAFGRSAHRIRAATLNRRRVIQPAALLVYVSESCADRSVWVCDDQAQRERRSSPSGCRTDLAAEPLHSRRYRTAVSAVDSAVRHLLRNAEHRCGRRTHARGRFTVRALVALEAPERQTHVCHQ